MYIEATEEEWRAALLTVVADAGPEYVYPKEEKVVSGYGDDYNVCQYITPGRPQGACVVGRALVLLGADPAELHNIGDGQIGGDGLNAYDLLSSYSNASEEVRDGYQVVQSYQDSDESWGTALWAVTGTEQFPSGLFLHS